MTSDKISTNLNSWRKWIGVIWLLIEMNLISANIFGFPALFKVFPSYDIYNNYCQSSINATEQDCTGQTQQYQNALTLGITFYSVPSMFIGILIDMYGGRFVKLIAIIFHVVGWLSLALVNSNRAYLLFLHTFFTSISSFTVQITNFTTCNYFSKSRAFLLSLFVGASLSSSMWYSIFQILIDNNKLTLSELSYIWMSFGILMFFSSFLFLDWKFPILNLNYKFNTTLEQIKSIPVSDTENKRKWYKNIRDRIGIWEHLTNPLYILVILYLSFLMMPYNLLSVTWYPWVYHINNNNKTISDDYTFAFNMSALSQIALCPIVGFLLSFRADRSPKQKVLNVAIVQTCSWIFCITTCIICMFVKNVFIIPALVFYYVGRSAICAASQAVVATFFPSEYIGRLTGIMWTTVGVINCIQYGLIKLTTDVTQSWRAWVIVLVFVVVMSCHVIQIWYITIKKFRKHILATKEVQSDVKTVIF